MRLPIASLVIATALLAGATQTASAQSPNSYPWCAQYYTRSTATSCYFASRQLCAQTVSGIGGRCYQNPGYRGAVAMAAPRRYRHRYY
jgi:Protein of unknown function (DUF3551)